MHVLLTNGVQRAPVVTEGRADLLRCYANGLGTCHTCPTGGDGELGHSASERVTQKTPASPLLVHSKVTCAVLPKDSDMWWLLQRKFSVDENVDKLIMSAENATRSLLRALSWIDQQKRKPPISRV